jgi:hypothetical protein
MKSTKTLIIFAALIFLSNACGKKSAFQTMEIPQEQARLQDLDNNPRKSSEKENPSNEQADQQDLLEDDFGQLDAVDAETPSETADSVENSEVKKPIKRSLAEIAKWVIQHEAKKVGAACNFFIQRILELMGFGPSSWTANSFDKYVKENFSSYQEESFVSDSSGVERKRLKAYIWSFPERTGLIFQWKRSSGHGHIAVVQRIQDELVIYHASLNTFRPKAQRVTLEVLLHPTRKNLNVFSDFKKSK